MRRRRLIHLLAAAVALAPCGTGPAAAQGNAQLPDPSRFLTGVVADIAANDYAHAWLSLYPAHQAVAPLDEYVACELKSPIPGRLDGVVVLRSVRATFPVAGLARRVRGAAVTFRIRISQPLLATSVDIRATFHAVPWDGSWRWILRSDRYQMYSEDRC
jgi:hypothetical protein